MRLFFQIWNTQLITIGGNWVIVGDVVTAAFVLGLGMLFARYFIRKRTRDGFMRMGVEPTPAILIENILYYTTIFLIFLVSLQVANIPLTIFTFLGGAVAIAFGFGAQNILNNFISGLIIMIEQPVRIGDMVEIEGNHGTVEEVGARCTRVRTFEGIYILVPNSVFLEKTVINWTLSPNKNVRVNVRVGVEYGSPTQQVAQLLRQAVKEQASIIPEPEPIILFSDFGDNTLDFEVHFWVKINTLMDAQQVKSDLRFRIDELFREHGIGIAFPQRDVHLDTRQPLQVHVVSPTM
ncbi:MAG: mechanosensitive ion channel protein [Gemmatimonadetes bacterium]|nr:MAG: mechanosensitive ion channel protein [Gemmatimonadota bacterium]